MAEARPLTEQDLPEAQRIVRRAFGTFLGAPNLDEFWTDFDYVYGRFGCEHTVGFAADHEGALAGSNFATRWGSVGFLGRCRPVPICGTTASHNRLSLQCRTRLRNGALATPACSHSRRAPSMCTFMENSAFTRAF